MIDALTGLGYGLISLAVVIGIGIVILAVLSGNVSGCATAYPYVESTNLCTHANGTTQSPSASATSMYTLKGYLGTSSGGLATWVPIIIVMIVGLLFLGAFASKRGQQA